MSSTSQIQPIPHRIDEAAQQPYTDAFDRYLIGRGYARNTARAYLGHASHFLLWTQRSGLDLRRIDEVVIARFPDDHLPDCNCGWRTRADSRDARAALGLE